LNLLELCRADGVNKFVLASTSSLCGAHNPLPFREDANTNHPLSPYAASKKAAEALCYTYHYLYGLDVTILRYFTIYGPAGRMDMNPFRCAMLSRGSASQMGPGRRWRHRQSVVWDQVQAFLPQAASAVLYWYNVGRNADVILVADPATDMSRELCSP
jgi:nucleoside-diphosphate-sugar epimerase